MDFKESYSLLVRHRLPTPDSIHEFMEEWRHHMSPMTLKVMSELAGNIMYLETNSGLTQRGAAKKTEVTEEDGFIEITA